MALSAAVVLTTVFCLGTVKLVLRPTSNRADHADAVVVLAGGGTERLGKAVSLVEGGAAGVLAVSDGGTQDPLSNNVRCRQDHPFRVVCFTPSPQSTRGEAEAIGRIARVQRWRRVIVVTSSYHVTRARLLVGRCFHGTLAVVAAHPAGNRALAWWAQRILHEWAGLIDSELHRGC